MAYLSQNYTTPHHVLIPEQKALQAKWLEWCFFVVAELDSTRLYVMRRHGTINGLAHIYGEAPAVVSQAAEYFRHQLRHVDVALADGRTYLIGDQFTTADIILTTCLTWAIDYGVGISAVSRTHQGEAGLPAGLGRQHSEESRGGYIVQAIR